jgi:DNA-directed RNA polymerase specialized sigma24 family protein
VQLKHWDGLKNREIAEIIGVNVSTVPGRLKVAQTRLGREVRRLRNLGI